jgi:hypothetical protein
MAHALRSHLFKCYGSFADKRIALNEKAALADIAKQGYHLFAVKIGSSVK